MIHTKVHRALRHFTFAGKRLGFALRRCGPAVPALALAGLLLMTPGCNVLGYVAAKAGPDPDRANVQRYTGLKGQTCAVMVWADWTARVNFPPIRSDVATTLQARLEDEGIAKVKEKDLEQTQFPYPANSVVLFQDQHPDMMHMPITDAVMRLGIENLSRVIYIEVESFETRYPQSEQLFRGSMKAKLRVVEIANNKASVTFEEPIEVRFPPRGADALPPGDKVNDRAMYYGTIGEFARAAAMRFYDVPG